MVIHFRSADEYRIFSQDVARANRYIRDRRSQRFLKILRVQAHERKRSVPQGWIFWRAQLGHSSEPWYQGEEYIDDLPRPLSPSRMKPPPDSACDGRANPKGIPYLYGANRKETAISEVRPWLGLMVSLAQLKTTRPLSVVDCSCADKPSRPLLGDVPKEEWDKAVWWDIDHAFSYPVTGTNSTAEYAPTQVIAEAFKADGFDGILYRSAFGDGHNVVFFDLNAAIVINCGLYEIRHIALKFAEVANPYFLRDPNEEVSGT